MNTRKHLNIIYNLATILLFLSVIGIIFCFIAMIADGGALPFLICAIAALSLYFSKVFLSVIIDFYDAVVTKNKVYNAILNTIGEDEANSQEQ